MVVVVVIMTEDSWQLSPKIASPPPAARQINIILHYQPISYERLLVTYDSSSDKTWIKQSKPADNKQFYFHEYLYLFIQKYI